MVNTPAAQPLKPTYGPVTFVAALANILLVETAVWVVLPWYLLALYGVPLLLVDLLAATVLKSRPGRAGQIGRGMLIGLLSVPAGLALFLPLLGLAQVLGLF